MGRDPVVTGWKGATFAGVDFAKYVTRWEDTRQRAGTVHKYNKRDGGEGEDMGRDPHKAVVHLAYIGQTWRADFLKLQSAIDSTPIATLTHPLYGSMTAYCRVSTGTMDLESSPNLYEVTLSFEESQVDTNATADTTVSNQGPTTKQQAVTGTATLLSSTASQFTSAASAVASLTSAATTFAAAAVAASQTLVPDPTLSQQLASVLSLTTAAQTAILSDPLAAPGTSDPAVDLCEQLYDYCTQLDEAVRALRPQLSVYVVPMTMHLTALAQLFYGSADGPTREAEILTNNAEAITDPGFILAGTQLLMAPATVVRS